MPGVTYFSDVDRFEYFDNEPCFVTLPQGRRGYGGNGYTRGGGGGGQGGVTEVSLRGIKKRFQA